jgi:iron complex outermembrane recepter protein
VNPTRYPRLTSTTAIGTAAIVLAVAAPSTAYAQDTVTDCTSIAEASGRAACEAANAALMSDGDIVVTGSRLQRSEYTSPDPLQIVSPVLALRKGEASVAEMLQGSPVAAGSTQLTAGLSSNFVLEGGMGTETVSLRGLGANRTLVLLNGRRAAPAGTRGSVSGFDLNVLPLSVIEQVDVLKTGASSIYGSDAIAGVVNIRTRTDLDGVDVRGFVSAPEESGGEIYNVSAAMGRVFDGARLMIAGDFYHREELAVGDREYLSCTEEYLFRPDGRTRADLVDPRTGKFVCNGRLTNVIGVTDLIAPASGGRPTNLLSPGGLAIPYIQTGDRLGEFLPVLRAATSAAQFSAPPGYYGVNYDGVSTALINQNSVLEQQQSVVPETTRYTGYLSGAVDLTPGIELFAEGLYNRRETYVNKVRLVAPFQFTGSSLVPLITGVPGATPTSGDPLNKEFGGAVLLQPIVQSDRADFATDVDYYRGVLGARGDLGSWNWNTHVQYSRSDGSYTSDVLFADSLAKQELRTKLCAGTTTAVRGVPCIDIDFTDPRVLRGDFTQQELDFLFGSETGRTIYDQWSAEGFASGTLATLPAGDVKAVLGAHYRRDTIEDTPGAESLRGNASGAGKAGITSGRQETKELFGELEVPLIADAPIARAFTLSAAGRLTSVESVRKSDGASDSDNGHFTYKLGANWQVNDVVRLRTTYGTSFRSPALFEQFLAKESIGSLRQADVDPCIRYAARLASGAIGPRLANNCAAAGIPGTYPPGVQTVTVTSGGSIGRLDPETSRAWTASLILTTPPTAWGTRLSLAIDYVDIRIENEIVRLPPAEILEACYDSEDFPNEPMCGLFTRIDDPTSPRNNQITVVTDDFINISKQHNRSVDVTGRIAHDLGRAGNLMLLAQMSWQFEDEIERFAGKRTDNNGEVGEPRWVGDFSLSWNRGPYTLLYGLDAIGGTSNYRDLVGNRGAGCTNSTFRGGLICPAVKLDPTFYHSLSLTTEVKPGFEFNFGVSNLTNQRPQRASTINSGIPNVGQTPARGTYYDPVGRRFFAGAKAKF